LKAIWSEWTMDMDQLMTLASILYDYVYRNRAHFAFVQDSDWQILNPVVWWEWLSANCRFAHAYQQRVLTPIVIRQFLQHHEKDVLPLPEADEFEALSNWQTLLNVGMAEFETIYMSLVRDIEESLFPDSAAWPTHSVTNASNNTLEQDVGRVLLSARQWVQTCIYQEYESGQELTLAEPVTASLTHWLADLERVSPFASRAPRLVTGGVETRVPLESSRLFTVTATSVKFDRFGNPIPDSKPKRRNSLSESDDDEEMKSTSNAIPDVTMTARPLFTAPAERERKQKERRQTRHTTMHENQQKR